MDSPSAMPEWLRTAIIGAVSAALGFFGKELWSWWNKQRQKKQGRRARLERLDRLLDESGSLFRSQRAQAQRLVESIAHSQPSCIKPNLSLDQIFSLAYANLSPEELRLHDVIRGVTATSMKRVNSEIVDWLRRDDFFTATTDSPVELKHLAKELRKLRLHLGEWHAKFSSVFELDRTIALNYLADEQEHGTRFPVGIEDVVKQILREGL
jgi:hypothetical protein